MKVPEDFLITTISGNKIRPPSIDRIADIDITDIALTITVKIEYTENGFVQVGYVGYFSDVREPNFSYEAGTEEFDQMIFEIYLTQVLR